MFTKTKINCYNNFYWQLNSALFQENRKTCQVTLVTKNINIKIKLKIEWELNLFKKINFVSKPQSVATVKQQLKTLLIW